MEPAVRQARENAEEPDYDGRADADDETDEADEQRFRRIRCPRCLWQPQKHDRWQCDCLYEWNTFDTAALCPACGKQWEWTQCLRCNVRSPHKDWYTDGERS